MVFAEIGRKLQPGYMSSMGSLLVAGGIDGGGMWVNSLGSMMLGGDLGGTVQIVSALPGGPNDVPIRIGGSLLTTGSIALSVSGLTSQTIVNANDSNESWQGAVTVNGVSLVPVPDYDEASAILGGGAVGEVPFRLHSSNCWPFAGEAVARDSAPTTSNPIKMRHYGPVWFDPAGPKPFKVMRSAPMLAGGWSDETDCFSMSIDSNKTIVNLYPNLPNDALIQGGFTYSVTLAVDDNTGENILRCDLAETLRPEVADYAALSFDVDECIGDADNDGDVDFDDTLSVLANWGSPLCLKYGDADRNGLVNYDDILRVLANFGHDCTMIELAGGGGGGGGGMEEAAQALAGALEAMGFESLENFFAAFESADKATRDEMMQTLGELLGGKK